MATPAVDPAHRRDLYAYGVVKLERDPVDRFAEGTFDTAVTNGLAAIVDSFQPVPVPASRVPSAGVMLETLRTTYGAPGDPTVAVPVAAAGTTDTVTIAVQQLLDVLARTQAPRHGRGASGTVTSADIEALRDLDDHTALNCLHSTLLDEHWSRVQFDDSNELGRAAIYLSLLTERLGDDGMAERAERARGSLVRGDPEDYEAQDCPVCGNDGTLTTDSIDDLGVGYGPGTCVVCSYERSSEIAYQLAMETVYENKWRDA
jgi:hypothetical protein